MGAGASAATAAAIKWPDSPRARLSPAGELPAGLSLDAPVPCRDSGVPYWLLGGPSKARVRVNKDESHSLKLGASFTVAARFRASVGAEKAQTGCDSLILGSDNKHWLAVQDGKLCLVDGEAQRYHFVDSQGAEAGRWVAVFLQPAGHDSTAVLAVDGEGPIELGVVPMSLVGSAIRTLGWAPSEVHLAEVLVWDRCISWTEMGRVHAALPPAPPPPEEDRPRAKFRGRVVDLSGRGLPDVRVNWGRGGCFDGDGVTDENGCFAGDISDAETEVPDDASGVSSESACTVFSFSCEGFAPTTTRAACSGAGPETTMQVALRPVSATTVVNAEVGGHLEDPATGSSVTIPPGALVQQNGSPAVGAVKISLSVIDVTDPAALTSMPGDFSAVGEDGTVGFLQSLGAMWIGAQDEKGAELSIKEDSEGVGVDLKSTATADMGKLGSAAEMWSFNESSGRWELESIPMEVDGQLAPNSASAISEQAAESDSSEGPNVKWKKKGRETGRGKMGKASKERRVVKGGMSAEQFAEKVAKEGEKSLSTKVKKLGYINCDILYRSPTNAVMLKGRILTAAREPLAGVQLWCQGRDYAGRTPDATDKSGSFSAMVAQFDSTVDIVVNLQVPAPNDDVIEVFFKHMSWYDKVPRGDARAKLGRVVGKYQKAGSLDGKPSWQPGNPSETALLEKIVWCQARRRWQHCVGSTVVLFKEGGDSPEGAGWQLAPAFQTELLGDKKDIPVGVPLYSRAISIEKRVVGPFQTGPPGEVVDVGEVAVP